MATTITLTLVAHDVAGIVKKIRIECSKTQSVDKAELTFPRDALLAIHTPTINDAIAFERDVGTPRSTPLFNGRISKVRYESNNIVVEALSNLKFAKETEITDSWPSTVYDVMMTEWFDVPSYPYPFASVEGVNACLDGTVTNFIMSKEQIWNGLVRVANVLNCDFRHEAVAMGAAAWFANGLIFKVAGYGYSTITLEAGHASSNEIVGRPKWTTDESEIINSVTVLYKGGSVTQHDDDSITAYGTRQTTVARKDIDNATDAQLLADNIIAGYHDPRNMCECKVLQGAAGYWYVAFGSTYELLPFYFNTTVDDAFSGKNVSGLDCDKIIIQWPERFDVVTFGQRRAYTKGYLESMESRIYNIEKAVDQDVLTTSTPTFAGIQSPLSVGNATNSQVSIVPANANWGALNCLGASTQASSFRIITDAGDIYFFLDVDDVGTTESFIIYKNSSSTVTATKIFEIDAAGNITTSPGINVTGALALHSTTTTEIHATTGATIEGGTTVGIHAGTDVELHPTGKILANADVFAGTNYWVGRNSQTDTLRHSHDAENSTTNATYAKVKTITFASGLGGYYRIKFDMMTNDADGMAYGKLYLNGSPFGNEQTTVSLTYVTKVENFTTSLSPGDALQLYIHNDGTYRTYVQNFRVYYDPDFTVPSANS